MCIYFYFIRLQKIKELKNTYQSRIKTACIYIRRSKISKTSRAFIQFALSKLAGLKARLVKHIAIYNVYAYEFSLAPNTLIAARERVKSALLSQRALIGLLRKSREREIDARVTHVLYIYALQRRSERERGEKTCERTHLGHVLRSGRRRRHVHDCSSRDFKAVLGLVRYRCHLQNQSCNDRLIIESRERDREKGIFIIQLRG